MTDSSGKIARLALEIMRECPAPRRTQVADLLGELVVEAVSAGRVMKARGGHLPSPKEAALLRDRDFQLRQGAKVNVAALAREHGVQCDTAYYWIRKERLREMAQ